MNIFKRYTDCLPVSLPITIMVFVVVWAAYTLIGLYIKYMGQQFEVLNNDKTR